MIQDNIIIDKNYPGIVKIEEKYELNENFVLKKKNLIILIPLTIRGEIECKSLIAKSDVVINGDVKIRKSIKSKYIVMVWGELKVLRKVNVKYLDVTKNLKVKGKVKAKNLLVYGKIDISKNAIIGNIIKSHTDNIRIGKNLYTIHANANILAKTYLRVRKNLTTLGNIRAGKEIIIGGEFSADKVYTKETIKCKSNIKIKEKIEADHISGYSICCNGEIITKGRLDIFADIDSKNIIAAKICAGRFLNVSENIVATGDIYCTSLNVDGNVDADKIEAEKDICVASDLRAKSEIITQTKLEVGGELQMFGRVSTKFANLSLNRYRVIVSSTFIKIGPFTKTLEEFEKYDGENKNLTEWLTKWLPFIKMVQDNLPESYKKKG